MGNAKLSEKERARQTRNEIYSNKMRQNIGAEDERECCGEVDGFMMENLVRRERGRRTKEQRGKYNKAEHQQG